MIDIDLVDLKTGLHVLLLGEHVAQLCSFSAEHARDKSLEAKPLVNVPVHILFPCEQDHTA